MRAETSDHVWDSHPNTGSHCFLASCAGEQIERVDWRTFGDAAIKAPPRTSAAQNDSGSPHGLTNRGPTCSSIRAGSSSHRRRLSTVAQLSCQRAHEHLTLRSTRLSPYEPGAPAPWSAHPWPVKKARRAAANSFAVRRWHRPATTLNAGNSRSKTRPSRSFRTLHEAALRWIRTTTMSSSRWAVLRKISSRLHGPMGSRPRPALTPQETQSA